MAQPTQAEDFSLALVPAPPMLDNVTPGDVDFNEHDNGTQHYDGVGQAQTIIVISSVTIVTAISSFLNGLVTVGIPVIALDLHLESSLILWPQSIQSLTCGCTLLLLGSLGDIFGGRRLYLLGCVLQSLSSLACGLSRTGTQLIVFRAFTGLSSSFCLPSAVSIINHTFAPGRQRSFAFASMGGGNPAGFGLGLLLGGVFAGTIGWRWGFYVTTIVNSLVYGLAAWQLPRTTQPDQQETWRRLRTQTDWVGVVISSTSLAMLSYVLASLTSTTLSIKRPITICLLVLGLILVPTFVLWLSRQERLGRPALIPNSLWRNRIFTSICINVFLIWGSFNAFEQIANLFFQNVQKLSPLQAAVRFIPGPISGIIASVLMGFIVHRVRGDIIIASATLISCTAPIMMALVNPRWIYWEVAFPAIFLNPMGAGVAFTISNLLITSSFPAETQALAGGVFNTIAQLGNAVGMTLAILIAETDTARAEKGGGVVKGGPDALMTGYRAAYWFFFGLCTTAVCVSFVGLHKVGVVGSKRT